LLKDALMDKLIGSGAATNHLGKQEPCVQASLKIERDHTDALSWAAFILIGLPHWVAEINLQFLQ